jgi:hypothetical protein
MDLPTFSQDPLSGFLVRLLALSGCPHGGLGGPVWAFSGPPGTPVGVHVPLELTLLSGLDRAGACAPGNRGNRDLGELAAQTSFNIKVWVLLSV